MNVMNVYDEPVFFEQYSQMARSVKGLEGAGEWHELQKMLPDFRGKRVLDLGCGFGWHCRYAECMGAKLVVGVDVSEKMLNKAEEMTQSDVITYKRQSIEEIAYGENTFDVVVSSLALHYVDDFKKVCQKVAHVLPSGGVFVFSVEHPIFTAEGSQNWIMNEAGDILYWPVDHYFEEGNRETTFLGEAVHKYHKTLMTYVNDLIGTGFEITQLVEPQPSEVLLKGNQEMQNELRRPMMLLIGARKK
ncbi:MAG: class I SAM-dependent methyltransferase [Cellulosilyticaceae bacterium]